MPATPWLCVSRFYASPPSRPVSNGGTLATPPCPMGSHSLSRTPENPLSAPRIRQHPANTRHKHKDPAPVGERGLCELLTVVCGVLKMAPFGPRVANGVGCAWWRIMGLREEFVGVNGARRARRSSPCVKRPSRHARESPSGGSLASTPPTAAGSRLDRSSARSRRPTRAAPCWA